MSGSKEGSKKQKNLKSKQAQNKQDDGASKADAEKEARKAEMEIKIRARVAKEVKAFDIVNRLIEPDISTDYLLEACQYIDDSHYEDVVEERSISHLCGYPVCSNALSQVPKQKYHISPKFTTVYDITDRKRFCSNQCYHASKHLLKQIPNTPVWTRTENTKKRFSLVKHDDSKKVGRLQGEEVISMKVLGLKDEMLLLDKLDKLEKKSQRSPSCRKNPKSLTPESFQENMRLSKEMMSVDTDTVEKLTSQTDSLSLTDTMEKLTSQTDSLSLIDTVEKLTSRTDSLSLTDRGDTVPEKSQPLCLQPDGTSVTGDHRNSLEHGVVTGECGDNMKGAGDRGQRKESGADRNSAALETSLRRLTLRNSGAIDSDDDTDDDEVQRGDISSNETRLSDASKASQGLHVDMMRNDQRGTGCDNLDNSVVCSLPSQTQNKTDLEKQEEESKSVYLERLLVKNKGVLSKIADIQSTSTNTTPHSSDVEKVTASDKIEPLVGEIKHSDSDSQNRHASVQSDNARKPDKKKDTEDVHTRVKGKSAQNRIKIIGIHTAFAKMTELSGERKLPSLDSIFQMVSSWITAETLTLLGMNSVQGGGGEDTHDSETFFKDPEMQKKYQKLCQRVAYQEKDFEDILGEEEEAGEEKDSKKPLPNFEQLRRETEGNLRLVQRFLGKSAFENNRNLQEETETGKDKEETDSDKRPIVLPVVDSHNQLLIRKRIVLQRLNNSITSVLPPVGLSVYDVSASLRELVYTFSLSSHNITFKPVEWTLVAIILLIMLENKSKAVSVALLSESRVETLNTVLGRLGCSVQSLRKAVQTTLMECKLASD